MKIARLTLTINNNTVSVEDFDLDFDELKLLYELLKEVIKRDC